MPFTFERVPVSPETPDPEKENKETAPDVSAEDKKREHVTQLYNRRAEESGLHTDNDHTALLGEWLNADGMEYAHILPTGRTTMEGKVPTNMESKEVVRERLENIGKFAYNNGVIARINEKGEMIVAPYSKYREKQLQEAGYRNGSFFVPLSNAEQPLNKEQRERWQRMRTYEHERDLPYVLREQQQKARGEKPHEIETPLEGEKRERVIQTYNKKADKLDIGGLYKIEETNTLQQLLDEETPLYVRVVNPYSSRPERPRRATPEDLQDLTNKEYFTKDEQRDEALLGEWLVADGMENAQIMTNGLTALEGRVPTNVDSKQVIQERLNKIGSYAYNNGVLAFIDKNGEMRVAPYSQYRRQRLEEMGFKNGSFGVPLSNWQVPLDKAMREKWRRLRDAEKGKREV